MLLIKKSITLILIIALIVTSLPSEGFALRPKATGLSSAAESSVKASSSGSKNLSSDDVTLSDKELFLEVSELIRRYKTLRNFSRAILRKSEIYTDFYNRWNGFKKDNIYFPDNKSLDYDPLFMDGHTLYYMDTGLKALNLVLGVSGLPADTDKGKKYREYRRSQFSTIGRDERHREEWRYFDKELEEDSPAGKGPLLKKLLSVAEFGAVGYIGVLLLRPFLYIGLKGLLFSFWHPYVGLFLSLFLMVITVNILYETIKNSTFLTRNAGRYLSKEERVKRYLRNRYFLQRSKWAVKEEEKMQPSVSIQANDPVSEIMRNEKRKGDKGLSAKAGRKIQAPPEIHSYSDRDSFLLFFEWAGSPVSAINTLAKSHGFKSIDEVPGHIFWKIYKAYTEKNFNRDLQNKQKQMLKQNRYSWSNIKEQMRLTYEDTDRFTVFENTLWAWIQRRMGAGGLFHTLLGCLKMPYNLFDSFLISIYRNRWKRAKGSITNNLDDEEVLRLINAVFITEKDKAEETLPKEKGKLYWKGQFLYEAVWARGVFLPATWQFLRKRLVLIALGLIAGYLIGFLPAALLQLGLSGVFSYFTIGAHIRSTVITIGLYLKKAMENTQRQAYIAKHHKKTAGFVKNNSSDIKDNPYLKFQIEAINELFRKGLNARTVYCLIESIRSPPKEEIAPKYRKQQEFQNIILIPLLKDLVNLRLLTDTIRVEEKAIYLSLKEALSKRAKTVPYSIIDDAKRVFSAIPVFRFIARPGRVRALIGLRIIKLVLLSALWKGFGMSFWLPLEIKTVMGLGDIADAGIDFITGGSLGSVNFLEENIIARTEGANTIQAKIEALNNAANDDGVVTLEESEILQKVQDGLERAEEIYLREGEAQAADHIQDIINEEAGRFKGVHNLFAMIELEAMGMGSRIAEVVFGGFRHLIRGPVKEAAKIPGREAYRPKERTGDYQQKDMPYEELFKELYENKPQEKELTLADLMKKSSETPEAAEELTEDDLGRIELLLKQRQAKQIIESSDEKIEITTKYESRIARAKEDHERITTTLPEPKIIESIKLEGTQEQIREMMDLDSFNGRPQDIAISSFRDLGKVKLEADFSSQSDRELPPIIVIDEHDDNSFPFENRGGSTQEETPRSHPNVQMYTIGSFSQYDLRGEISDPETGETSEHTAVAIRADGLRVYTVRPQDMKVNSEDKWMKFKFEPENGTVLPIDLGRTLDSSTLEYWDAEQGKWVPWTSEDLSITIAEDNRHQLRYEGDEELPHSQFRLKIRELRREAFEHYFNPERLAEAGNQFANEDTVLPEVFEVMKRGKALKTVAEKVALCKDFFASNRYYISSDIFSEHFKGQYENALKFQQAIQGADCDPLSWETVGMLRYMGVNCYIVHGIAGGEHTTRFAANNLHANISYFDDEGELRQLEPQFLIKEALYQHRLSEKEVNGLRAALEAYKGDGDIGKLRDELNKSRASGPKNIFGEEDRGYFREWMDSVKKIEDELKEYTVSYEEREKVIEDARAWEKRAYWEAADTADYYGIMLKTARSLNLLIEEALDRKDGEEALRIYKVKQEFAKKALGFLGVGRVRGGRWPVLRMPREKSEQERIEFVKENFPDNLEGSTYGTRNLPLNFNDDKIIDITLQAPKDSDTFKIEFASESGNLYEFSFNDNGYFNQPERESIIPIFDRLSWQVLNDGEKDVFLMARGSAQADYLFDLNTGEALKATDMTYSQDNRYWLGLAFDENSNKILISNVPGFTAGADPNKIDSLSALNDINQAGEMEFYIPRDDTTKAYLRVNEKNMIESITLEEGEKEKGYTQHDCKNIIWSGDGREIIAVHRYFPVGWVGAHPLMADEKNPVDKWVQFSDGTVVVERRLGKDRGVEIKTDNQSVEELLALVPEEHKKDLHIYYGDPDSRFPNIYSWLAHPARIAFFHPDGKGSVYYSHMFKGKTTDGFVLVENSNDNIFLFKEAGDNGTSILHGNLNGLPDGEIVGTRVQLANNSFRIDTFEIVNKDTWFMPSNRDKEIVILARRPGDTDNAPYRLFGPERIISAHPAIGGYTEQAYFSPDFYAFFDRDFRHISSADDAIEQLNEEPGKGSFILTGLPGQYFYTYRRIGSYDWYWHSNNPYLLMPTDYNTVYQQWFNRYWGFERVAAIHEGLPGIYTVSTNADAETPERLLHNSGLYDALYDNNESPFRMYRKHHEPSNIEINDSDFRERGYPFYHKRWSMVPYDSRRFTPAINLALNELFSEYPVTAVESAPFFDGLINPGSCRRIRRVIQISGLDCSLPGAS